MVRPKDNDWNSNWSLSIKQTKLDMSGTDMYRFGSEGEEFFLHLISECLSITSIRKHVFEKEILQLNELARIEFERINSSNNKHNRETQQQ